MANTNFLENEVIEFKKTTGELKEGIISIVSILNKHQGGKLYFGIKDNGEIIGQDVSSKTIREVSKAISENIEPKIYPIVNKVKLNDKDCILVEFEGDDIPYLAFGRAYMRVGDEDRQLSMKEIRKIILRDGDEIGKWESKVSDYTIDDIDEELLKEFIEKGRKAKRINFPYTNKEEILKKLSLINKNNELLNAGHILFAKEAKLEMQMAIFATETKLTFLDIDQVFGNIFELIETGEGYIRKNIKWPVNFKSGGMERVEIPEIPLEAIREAIINSLIHRDFKNPKSNEVAIYKDRVEIFNPGEFPEGYKPEDFIKGEGSIPRNPLLANTLYLSKDIEKWGSGFRRITEVCAKADVKVKFEIRKNGFMVIFYRKTDEELLDLTGEDKNNSANDTENGTQIDTEKLILNLLEQTPDITQKELSEKTNISLRTVKRIIQQLKEKNKIERVGSDRKGYWKINNGVK
ncbi:MAG: winged helix-turn-helix transcriptional regulator [Clostridia bacterium]|nr:winged helix-turn-helix transcriptional regulator [Clostridia bacterium]